METDEAMSHEKQRHCQMAGLLFFFHRATLSVILSCQEEDMGPHPNALNQLPSLGCVLVKI